MHPVLVEYVVRLRSSGTVGQFRSIFAFTFAAFFSVIMFSMAAGMRTSTFRASSSSFVICLAPGTFITEPVSSLHFATAAGSRPPLLYTPPLLSLTATTLHPKSSLLNRAAKFPAFP